MQKFNRWLLMPMLLIVAVGVYVAQESTPEPTIDCSPSQLKTQQDFLSQLLSSDFTNNSPQTTADMFRYSLVLQKLALDCGYQPTEDEINVLIDHTLTVSSVEAVIASTSVGDDVAGVVASLKTLNGDSFNGQLLYNSLENGLDGGALGCAGCHNGETAPSIEGTWTRVTDVRLKDPQLAGYTVEQYLVESILHPNAYIAEGFKADLMPNNFGKRLELQQLADLVAFLDSQDQ